MRRKEPHRSTNCRESSRRAYADFVRAGNDNKSAGPHRRSSRPQRAWTWLSEAPWIAHRAADIDRQRVSAMRTETTLCCASVSALISAGRISKSAGTAQLSTDAFLKRAVRDLQHSRRIYLPFRSRAAPCAIHFERPPRRRQCEESPLPRRQPHATLQHAHTRHQAGGWEEAKGG